MTKDDDATTDARSLTAEQAAARAETNAILAANCRTILLEGTGDDTTRQARGYYDALARACQSRAAETRALGVAVMEREEGDDEDSEAATGRMVTGGDCGTDGN